MIDSVSLIDTEISAVSISSFWLCFSRSMFPLSCQN